MNQCAQRTALDTHCYRPILNSIINSFSTIPCFRYTDVTQDETKQWLFCFYGIHMSPEELLNIDQNMDIGFFF